MQLSQTAVDTLEEKLLSKVKWLSAALILSVSLCGCDGQVKPSETAEQNTVTFFAMDTAMDLTSYGDAQNLEQAKGRVAELESLFSVTDESGELYEVNHNGRAILSDDTLSLLSNGLELCRRTKGALDLSICPVVRVWGFTTGNYHVPDDSELSELLSHVDYTGISLNRDTKTVTLRHGMEIDFGSIAKGYTGDQLLKLFQESGITSALLNLGGNVQALGSKPDGSPWRVAVKNPTGDGILGVLSIEDRAVITSGGYERYFESGGQIYWHIIDPATGYPAQNGLISVTVVGESGVVCDGLSTALFVMGPEAAVGLWRASDDFEAVLVLEDGSVSITEGLESTFTLTGSYADVPLTVIRHD